MNKSALKSFATEARLELLEKIQLQARKLGITPDAIQHASLESSDAIFIEGKPLSDVERKQRNKLITRVKEIGYDRVMEEAAYTWFNRFIALRYMEVNDYLPTKVRVLSSVNPDSTEPDMFREALNLDLPIVKELVYKLKIENNTDELFEYLIKVHCNDLNRYMPFMFETIDGYMEILFPKGLLGTDTFVRAMTNVNVIPEEDWLNVEIVGWLYQYYISDENERVIKAKEKYKKEEIPYATQLFTPEWIVRYMVQNALGRYWVESHPEHRDLIDNWEYYLENPNPEPDFDKKIALYINKELNVEDIKCYDPAMGSGHILAYMFDVLYEIYSKCGYMEREIPRLIIEKNLYGLDIDERAFQLASFTLVMKALQYNKRFLRSIEREGLNMNLLDIQETDSVTDEDLIYLAGINNEDIVSQIKSLIDQFKDAKLIGSLCKIKNIDLTNLKIRIAELANQEGNLFDLGIKERILPLIEHLLKQMDIMNKQYDILISNPPYAGRNFLDDKLKIYLDENYSEYNSDLFAAFIEMSRSKVIPMGHLGFITPFVWMFIATYEKMRKSIIHGNDVSSLIQLEYNSFEAAMVPVCTFTLRNYSKEINGEYIKLSDFKGESIQSLKTLEAIENPKVNYRYTVNQKLYLSIPGSPFAYWASEKFVLSFDSSKLGERYEVKSGIMSGKDPEHLRIWYEVNSSRLKLDSRSAEDMKNYKWFPLNKGGDYRLYYGNNEYVINLFNDGERIKEISKNYRLRDKKYYFLDGITWSRISSSKIAFRESRSGTLFGDAGPMIFIKDEKERAYILGLLISNVTAELLQFINPTMNYQVGDIESIPVKYENIDYIEVLVKQNIDFMKFEWNLWETSYDFKGNLLMVGSDESIEIRYKEFIKVYEKEKLDFIDRHKKINQHFISLYGLGEEVSSEPLFEMVEEINLENVIKNFISYTVGCIFGRYNIDNANYIFAGGEFNSLNYKSTKIVNDNIIALSRKDIFENDIVGLFIDFLKDVYSEESLEKNLEFIAMALNKKDNETTRETLHRYFFTDFYKDHVQIYKKRPIYWLFTSGKEKAFNCLIYMHRYDKTTLSRIRTDYVHEVQNRMDAEKNDLLNIINGDSTVKEIANAKKELKSLEKKIDELKKYDEILHHMADQQIEIDLDDGVKHNYELFKGLVAPIK